MPIYNDLFGIPERKKSINSKVKGNNNEYNVAKVLSKWAHTTFGRVPASGGLRWQGESRFIGDVVAQDEHFNFPFTVEVKSYKTIFIKNGTEFSKKVYSFWMQCLNDCERSGKIPMLMIRENKMPKDTWYIFFDPFLIKPNKLLLQTTIGDALLYVTRSDKFFSKITYKKFLTLIRK